MTSIYDPPIGTRPGSAPPGARRRLARARSPGGPGGPYGHYGYGGGGGGGPARRMRRKFLIFLYIVVIGLASFWGLQGQQPARQQGALSNSQIAAQVDPGLVDIVTTLGYQRAQAAGTGMVLSPSGEVLTNNHVIEGATSIKAVDVGNGRTYRATVAGYDRSHDVAVLKLHGASGLQTVATGNSAQVSPGEKVVAIGNAGGKGGTPSVVSGRIVALGATVTATDAAAGTSERLTGVIGHNAPIQPGDSGGPLVNLAAKVIGMNTAASSGILASGPGPRLRDPDQPGLVDRGSDRVWAKLSYGTYRCNRIHRRGGRLRGPGTTARCPGRERGPDRRRVPRVTGQRRRAQGGRCDCLRWRTAGGDA